MDKEHVKGAAEKASGAMKKGVGKATGDKALEAEGRIDKTKGAARDFLGDMKDEMRGANKDTREDLKKKH
jgi:uncharacterized protein YjbJ (UPF0337 family)